MITLQYWGLSLDLDQTWTGPRDQVQYWTRTRSGVCWTWSWGLGLGSTKSGWTGPGLDHGQSTSYSSRPWINPLICLAASTPGEMWPFFFDLLRIQVCRALKICVNRLLWWLVPVIPTDECSFLWHGWLLNRKIVTSDLLECGIL